MGLLDKLLKIAANKAATEAIRSVVNPTPSTQPARVAQPVAPSPVYNPPVAVVPMNPHNCISYQTIDTPEHSSFGCLLRQLFPSETIRENVPISALVPSVAQYAMPINYMFYRNNAAALAILVVSKDRYKLSSVLATMSACEQKGIPVLRFMMEFENQPSYVQNRIAEKLK